MTLTFNQDKYGLLLAKYQPKAIITETENEEAIAFAQELEHRPHLTEEEETLLELLLILIEKFEEENYPILYKNSHEILKHLITENNLKEEDLVDIIGSKELVSEVLNGKRSINKNQAKTLAEFFNVDISLFI